MAELLRIEGLRELEEGLKKLRENFGTKTGGLIYRGLSSGAMVIVKDAKKRAPKKDPSGFLRARLERQLAQKAGGIRRSKNLKSAINRSLALIKQNIIQRKIAANSPLAGGKPTVIVGVRARGYERVDRVRGKGRKVIRFKSPGTSPGYWWWLEFGASRIPAQPFLRPAFNAQKSNAVEEMRRHIAAAIKAEWGKNFKAAA